MKPFKVEVVHSDLGQFVVVADYLFGTFHLFKGNYGNCLVAASRLK